MKYNKHLKKSYSDYASIRETCDKKSYNNFIKLIFKSAKIPYKLAFKDYPKTNFSSSRVCLLQKDKDSSFSVPSDYLDDY